MRLTALSRSALALGLTLGLTLADARARVPDLLALDRDHEAEARLLARIVAGCIRYTPMTAPAPPDGLTLDITGCAHAFDGEERLADDLAHRLAAGGVTARMARGDTPEMARALWQRSPCAPGRSAGGRCGGHARIAAGGAQDDRRARHAPAQDACCALR
jgi:protein ImuB